MSRLAAITGAPAASLLLLVAGFSDLAQSSYLDLGLVPGVLGPRWQDNRPIVLGHLLVGALDPRLVAVAVSDAALELVGDDGLRHAPQVLQRPDVAVDPVQALLAPARLSVA